MVKVMSKRDALDVATEMADALCAWLCPEHKSTHATECSKRFRAVAILRNTIRAELTSSKTCLTKLG